MDAIIDYLWANVTLEFATKFIIVYFFIIWIAIIVWVIKDISIRTNNIFFQILCVLIVFIGTPFSIFIYLLLRPGKTLYERYYDEIEDNLDIIGDLLEERRWEIRQCREQEKENTKPKEDVLDMIDDSDIKKETQKKYKFLAKKDNTSEDKKSEKKKKTQIKIKKF